MTNQLSLGVMGRKVLKQFPYLRRFKQNADELIYWRELELLRSLPLFAPTSSGPFKARANLTLSAANATLPLLAAVAQVNGLRTGQLASPNEICADPLSREAAAKLEVLLNSYGSDKASVHNYHLVYGMIMKNPATVQNFLEIGIGTNHTDVVSNMGIYGQPGASLRAFRDFLPNATCYGADIDRRILFQDERIRTFYVDQRDRATFTDLEGQLPPEVDIIIDDGLHTPEANLIVLLFALPKLRPGGWLVIEDIAAEALPLWQVTAALLPADSFKSMIISARHGLIFAMQKSVASVDQSERSV
jgi:hypothetical protein